MALLGALLLVTAVVLFILLPVARGQHASLTREDDELTEAEARRRVTLLALRDVEYDYHTGKLDEGDYLALRSELSAEALAALQEAEAEGGGGDPDIEAEIAAVRAGLDAGTTCGDCGHRNPDGSRFCAACGHALASREATPSS
ncbi:MAG: zinc ribbon domain-containing protein [Gemmatimonadetes bacterium]|nr:zinc ribbon domain-containing protein [Gemmatimonadota bacterium]MBT8403943.1 zinc ribbon domain-containing protein [Gemmatimonadota bacterium]NNK61805.1 zinc-ribbon domain-containing protein [Gemmatimonadota bacterium]